ncbi:MAG: DUF2459 domain-containing protein [Acetobacteraceae bacterium]
MRKHAANMQDQMNWRGRLGRAARRLIAVATIACGVATTLGACATNSAATGSPNSVAGAESIAVIGRGWHTELGLPVASLGAPLIGLARRFPGAVTLTFGFGDRAFVLARHRTLGDALGALLPSPGLVLVTGLNTTPQHAFDARQVVTMHVSRESFERIAAFVWASIERNNVPVPSPYGAGPYTGSLYYASTVDYDAFETCNTWIAQALRAGGLPVQASGVLFASQLMREARSARTSLESR